jgi:hypothetical protein
MRCGAHICSTASRKWRKLVRLKYAQLYKKTHGIRKQKSFFLPVFVVH